MNHTIVFHLIKTAKRLQNTLGLKSEELDLSPSEASALLIIDFQKNTNQIDIALKLHLKPASIVSLIDELEKLKLVTRRTPKDDRRKYQIKLTDKGKQEVKKIREQTNKLEEIIRKKLTAIEKLSEDPRLEEEMASHKNHGKEVKNEKQLPSTKPPLAP